MTEQITPVRIVGISGSLRRASFSTSLIRLLAQRAGPAITISLAEMSEIPLYNEDLDGEEKAAAVQAINATIAESDGVLIVTPEYNHGAPGVLKNALDWVSRPGFHSILKGEPVSIISSSLAFTGGVRAQYQLRETLIAMQAYVVPGPEVVVGGVHTKFKDETFLDETTLNFMLASLERLRSEVLVRSSYFAASRRDDAGVRQRLATRVAVPCISGADGVRAQPVWAQQPSLPAVNLGDTSFLDGIAYPGWVVELIGQGVNDNRTADNTGHVLPGSTNVNSGAALTHIAWLSHARYLGAWYGAEVVLSAAYVDTGGHGAGHGFGDVTVGPVILQWPKHSLFGMPIYQRALLDIDAPVGRYSRYASVNIGSNAWDIHPYYAVTLFPVKKLETSWRIHYLWNGTNADPPISQGYRSTQPGQAIHFNATASYEVVKNVYVGANGYYLKQITDARIDGVRLPNSKEQIGAIGPGLVVHKNKWFYFINGYHEIGAENLSEGNKLVLRVERVF